MRSLNLNYIHSIRLTTKQASTIKRIGEYKGKQALFALQTPELLASLKHVAAIESAESSNRIEGITAPRERVKAIVADTTKPQDRSEQEIAGYRDALELIHDSGEYMAFTSATIKQLHSTMYHYLPQEGGKWKRRDNEIVEMKTDGSKVVRFLPVSASETPEGVETLARNYGQAVQDFTTAIQIHPGYAKAYYGRALAHQKRRQYQMATQDFRRACDLGDKDACRATPGKHPQPSPSERE